MFEYILKYTSTPIEIKLTFHPDGRLTATNLMSFDSYTYTWRWRDRNLEVNLDTEYLFTGGNDHWEELQTFNDDDRKLAEAYENYLAQLVVT